MKEFLKNVVVGIVAQFALVMMTFAVGIVTTQVAAMIFSINLDTPILELYVFGSLNVILSVYCIGFTWRRYLKRKQRSRIHENWSANSIDKPGKLLEILYNFLKGILAFFLFVLIITFAVILDEITRLRPIFPNTAGPAAFSTQIVGYLLMTYCAGYTVRTLLFSRKENTTLY